MATDDGSVIEGWTGAALTAFVLGGSFIAERWLVPVWRPGLYLRLGLPLGESLVPLAQAPEGVGQTASVCWEVRDDAVLYWTDTRRRRGAFGLHGCIRLTERRDGRVDLDVRWSPPWTAGLAAVWLAGLGALRGEPELGGPIAMVLLVAVFIVYRQAAVSAAAELRWAFTSQDA